VAEVSDHVASGFCGVGLEVFSGSCWNAVRDQGKVFIGYGLYRFLRVGARWAAARSGSVTASALVVQKIVQYCDA
jgi:hypothetical protein